MRTGTLASVVFCGLFWGHASAQQPSRLNQDPDAARLITSDIPAFWRVFDKASLKNAAELFEREYFNTGTAGLRDFVNSRIQNGLSLAGAVAARPLYYAAIRKNTLAMEQNPTVTDAVRGSFRHLKVIYPEAVFPDVYFVIGRMNSAGTVSSNGLLIGIEMNARDDSTPTDELTDWERAVTGRSDNLPNIVAHELIHIQQPPERANATLLERALREGGAEFIGEMISDGIPNRIQRSYGDVHERDLWTEFRKEMQGTDVSRWMYQGDRSKDRPADLGYYIGYRICEAFYRHATDEREAVRDILHITNAETFLKESGYSTDR